MPAPIITREDLGNYLNRNLATDDMALAAVDAASDVCRTVSDQIINEVEGDELVLDDWDLWQLSLKFLDEMHPFRMTHDN